MPELKSRINYAFQYMIPSREGYDYFRWGNVGVFFKNEKKFFFILKKSLQT